ncbi:MAG: hypothetical protein QM803_09875 [Rhodocyclaceae bacterium]
MQWGALNAQGEGVSSTSNPAQRTTYVYDAAGRLLQTIGPRETTVVAYDGLGRVLATTKYDGQQHGIQTSYIYYDELRTTSIQYANGLKITSSYDLAGNMLTSTPTTENATFGMTNYFYDLQNKLTATKDADGVRHWYLYDEAGRKTGEVDGNGTFTEYVYNAAGWLIKKTVYAKDVNLTKTQDAVLDTTDAAGNVFRATTPLLRALLTSADASNEWYSYDDAGRIIRTVSSTGAITATEYDGASHVVSVTQYARTLTVNASLDVLAVGTPAADAGDRVTRYAYNADGLLERTLDGEGYLVRL